jgi:hypothetical protein
VKSLLDEQSPRHLKKVTPPLIRPRNAALPGRLI